MGNSMMIVWTLDTVNAPIFASDVSPATKWFLCVCGVLCLAFFKTATMLGVPDTPAQLEVLLDHHKKVCEQLNVNDMALNPRYVDLCELDTSVYNEDMVFEEYQVPPPRSTPLFI